MLLTLGIILCTRHLVYLIATRMLPAPSAPAIHRTVGRSLGAFCLALSTTERGPVTAWVFKCDPIAPGSRLKLLCVTTLFGDPCSAIVQAVSLTVTRPSSLSQTADASGVLRLHRHHFPFAHLSRMFRKEAGHPVCATRPTLLLHLFGGAVPS